MSLKSTDQLIKEIRAKKTISPALVAEVLERFNEFQKEAIAGSIFAEMHKKPKKKIWGWLCVSKKSKNS